MHKRTFLLVTLCLLSIHAYSCKSDPLADGLPDQIHCSLCHGSELNAAPPVSLDSSDKTTNISVGAHQSHINIGRFRKAINCDECHLVPNRVDQAGHVDHFPAEVVFG